MKLTKIPVFESKTGIFISFVCFISQNTFYSVFRMKLLRQIQIIISAKFLSQLEFHLKVSFMNSECRALSARFYLFFQTKAPSRALWGNCVIIKSFRIHIVLVCDLITSGFDKSTKHKMDNKIQITITIMDKKGSFWFSSVRISQEYNPNI